LIPSLPRLPTGIPSPDASLCHSDRKHHHHHTNTTIKKKNNKQASNTTMPHKGISPSKQMYMVVIAAIAHCIGTLAIKRQRLAIGRPFHHANHTPTLPSFLSLCQKKNSPTPCS
jgi:hypothetical protein